MTVKTDRLPLRDFRAAHPLLLDRAALLLILLLAVAMRVGYLGIIAHEDLPTFFVPRSLGVAQHGLLSMYADSAFNYPPLSLAFLGITADLWLRLGGSPVIEPTSAYIAIVKLFPLLAELGIVAVAWVAMPARSPLRWLVPGLLAIYPGLIVTTAFWGQTDSMSTLPILIAFVLLRKRHSRWAWVFFGLALMTKFQAVVAFPVLVALTFRREGWRSLLINAAVLALTIAVILLPFIASTGLASVMTPYVGAFDKFPVFTANAFNLWYVASPALWSPHPALLYEYLNDSQQILGALTAKNLGFFMLGTYTLLIMVVIWRRADEPHDYLWLTAICFGFFMLPTQIHERYMYPAAVACVFAVVSDRRMWGVALATFATYSYNAIVPTQAPFYYLGFNPLFILGDITLLAALANLLIFAALTWIMVRPPAADRRMLTLKLLYASLLLLLLIVGAQVILPAPLPPEAAPLTTTLDNTFRLGGYRLNREGDEWSLDLYWQAYQFNNRDYTIFVHVLQGDRTIAQSDVRPQNGLYPTWRWFRKRWIVTTHPLTIPAGATPDAIAVGMYDHYTMQRVPATQEDQPLPDNAIRVWSVQ